MNKTLLVIGTILAGIGLFIGGLLLGQANVRAVQTGLMMDGTSAQVATGMMGSWDGQAGPGMMGSSMMGMMMNGGMVGSGIMDGFGGLTSAEPLSIEEVETIVTDYIDALNHDNLTPVEIMIFDNHAYAQIVDTSSEMGAFEVLIDHGTGNVFPEPGPNMMWNSEYGMMASFGGGMMGNMMYDQPGVGMMGGNMMGYSGYTPETEITATAEEATAVAQEYLDAYLPGKTADEHVDEFPGYYTLHVLEDGEIVGMLSVNAYSGQVFLHHWHGDLIEMVDGDH